MATISYTLDGIDASPYFKFKIDNKDIPLKTLGGENAWIGEGNSHDLQTEWHSISFSTSYEFTSGNHTVLIEAERSTPDSVFVVLGTNDRSTFAYALLGK